MKLPNLFPVFIFVLVLSCPAREPDPIRGCTEVRALTGSELVLIGDYSNFLISQYALTYGKRLMEIEKQTTLREWMRNQEYTYAVAKTILRFRPAIQEAYQESEQFRLTDDAGKNVPIRETGYWLNPIGQARFPDFKDNAERRTKDAAVLHFAFLSLKTPLSPGNYSLTDPLGQKTSFRYDPEKNVSDAIKVNQVGYAPDAGRKFAYAGAWRGDLGPLPMKHFAGKNFDLVDAATGKTAFSAPIRLRADDPVSKQGAAFTGEETLELDFSAFKTPGHYRIRIPGVGLSLPFRIGKDVLGEAFYIHARGLYHKRCGMAKEAPWTQWTSGACHTTTREGNFPPDIRDYAQNDRLKDRGFFNADGKRVALKQFDLIAPYDRNPEQRKVLPGVAGGWHDAADYDRRPQHFNAVNDLLAAYLFFPANFTDGQLNLPESGNGIPDIVDEALYGMEVWRKAQRPDGGVGVWIEASSHPIQKNPALDRQPYYLSAVTREGTMLYAAHAGMTALVLKKIGQQDKMKLWLDSAIRAYDFAMNPAHRFQADYEAVINKKTESLHYMEAPDVSMEYLFKAAFNLSILTGDKKYLHDITGHVKEINRALGNYSWSLSPFLFAEFQTEGENIPELSAIRQRYQGLVIRFGEHALEMLDNNYPYRIPWYPARHAFSANMRWGTCHPLVRARYLITAWRLTGDTKYRDGAFLANDFHNGANPLGLSMTSGLGQRYPVYFLDFPSYSDNIAEFVPGITPYLFTYYIPYNDVRLAHGLYYDSSARHQFLGASLSMLPKRFTGGKDRTEKETRELLGKVWPVWRRFANVEAYTVDVSEYTIWETIAPAAAVTGCLMSPGFLPSDELKNRKPASDVRSLSGYVILP
ncbi:MAG: Cellulose 1,4-beta-cellobiosidase precursor [Lentisphaerae bacterium ADurb.Bin242]|nr:MAG: Cellulose 1,4-beta-cellobiosidase precursor [Lentisphaerae bacterium ADurb.Bin242]